MRTKTATKKIQKSTKDINNSSVFTGVTSAICLVATIFIIAPFVYIFQYGGSWLWTTISIVALPVSILSLIVAVTFAIEVANSSLNLYSAVNPYCEKEYKPELSTIRDMVRFVFSWDYEADDLGGFLIDQRPKTVRNVKIKQMSAEELAWYNQTDAVFRDALLDIPSGRINFRLQVRRAIGNRGMSKIQRQKLLDCVSMLLDPDRFGRENYWKAKLGNWFYYVPSTLRSESLVQRASEAVSSMPEPIVKAKEKTRPLDLTVMPPIEEKQTLGDMYVNLVKERHSMLPLERVQAVTPTHIDHKAVWAILIALAELGSGISIAGTWMRKGEKIRLEVCNIFKSEGWKYPGHKTCIKAIKWMYNEGLLNKRHHGEGYSLDFHIQGKSEVGRELSLLINQAKSMRSTALVR